MNITEQTLPAQGAAPETGTPTSKPRLKRRLSPINLAPSWKISIATRYNVKTDRTYWGASASNSFAHAATMGWSAGSDPSTSIAVGFYELTRSLPSTVAMTIAGKNAHTVFDVIREKTEWARELEGCTRRGKTPSPKTVMRAVRKAQKRIKDVRLAKDPNDRELLLLCMEAADLSKRANRAWPTVPKR